MAAERTEEPTPKRLEEARRRGEVAVSRDATSAAAMTAAIVALVLQGPATTARLVAYWKGAFAAAPAGGGASPALAAGLEVMARALAVPLAAAALVALGAGLLQTRGLLALGEPRRRRQPGEVRPLLAGLAGLAGAPAPRLAGAMGLVSSQLAERVALVALALGLADYLLVRRRHLGRLRMTREEVRREHKESEGDPGHRAERQRLHRELLEQRMVAEVRKADFVVVNPDHIAVALRYDRDGEAAPVVVARGERLLAERIKQVAREAGVPIFRDVTLARSLRDLPEGTEIPEALYEAVAEILRVVYAMPDPSSPSSSTPPPSVARHAGIGWKRA